MKTGINLYLDEFKPKVDLLGLPIVASVWLFVIVVFTVVFSVGKYNLDGSQAHLHDLQQELVTLRQLTQELQQKAALHTEDPRLLKEIEVQSARIISERNLLRTLQNHAVDKGNGYAQLMADLANFHHTSIWLTGVTYRDDAIILSGATAHPEAITEWLAQLSRSSYFRGSEFSDLSIITEEEAPYSRFTVATAAAKDASTTP